MNQKIHLTLTLRSYSFLPGRFSAITSRFFWIHLGLINLPHESPRGSLKHLIAERGEISLFTSWKPVSAAYMRDLAKNWRTQNNTFIFWISAARNFPSSDSFPFGMNAWYNRFTKFRSDPNLPMLHSLSSCGRIPVGWSWIRCRQSWLSTYYIFFISYKFCSVWKMNLLDCCYNTSFAKFIQSCSKELTEKHSYPNK